MPTFQMTEQMPWEEALGRSRGGPHSLAVSPSPPIPGETGHLRIYENRFGPKEAGEAKSPRHRRGAVHPGQAIIRTPFFLATEVKCS